MNEKNSQTSDAAAAHLEKAVDRLESAVGVLTDRHTTSMRSVIADRDAARIEVQTLKQELEAMRAEQIKMQSLVDAVARRVDCTIEQLELVIEA